MIKLILTMMIAFLPLGGFAHEGHDHTPGAVAAPHGGIMHDLEHMYLEFLVDAGGVKLYPYNHELEPLAISEVGIEGSATLPKKTKPEKVTFKPAGSGFSASFDAKGAHRYMLEVTVTYRGKKDKAKFNVEPQQ